MNIFLTGGSGYVGSRVAQRLLAAGHRVVGLARSSESARYLEAVGVTPHEGSLEQPETLFEAARQSDGVIHTAFGNDFDNFGALVQTDLAAIDVMLRALEGSGKPLIATNGPAFLGDTGDLLADESWPVDETSFFAPRAQPDLHLVAARARGVRSAVLRLPLFVYGEGGSVFVPALLHFARQARRSPYVGEGTNKVSALHVDDAARAFVLALEHGGAGEIYHLSDGTGPSFRSIAEAVGRNLGVSVQSVAREEAQAVWGPGLTHFFTSNNQIIASKARRELHWAPESGRLSLLDDIECGSYKQEP